MRRFLCLKNLADRARFRTLKSDLPGRLFSQAQTALLLPDSSPGVLPGGVEVLLGGHAVLLFEGAEKVVVTAKAAGLVHLGDGQPLLDEGAAAV